MCDKGAVPLCDARYAVVFQLMAQDPRYAQFLFQLSDLGGQLQVPKLRDTARAVLKLMPAGMLMSSLVKI